MTFKEIEAFYWVAVLGNFSDAALRLHITQSSLSKRVAELESSLGSALFERTTKKVQMTDTGRRMMPVARRMLDLMESLHQEVLGSSHLTGECRFGISELVALTWLPDLVRRVREQHPGLKLKPYVDLALNLEKRVVKGDLDFAVAAGPSEGDTLVGSTVSTVEFAWIAAPGRISPGTVLTPSELSKYPLITMTEGSGLTSTFDRWSRGLGAPIQRTVACNSLMGILALILADTGISFLPTQFVKPWLDKGLLVALQSTPPFPNMDYAFIARVGDGRILVKELQQLVLQSVGTVGWTSPFALT
jgi:DNA-binding transcriptional LysR family regulator